MARSELKWRARRVWPWLFAKECGRCHVRFLREAGYEAWKGHARPERTWVCGPNVVRTFCGECAADEQEAIVLARQLLSGVPPFHPATNRCEED